MKSARECKDRFEDIVAFVMGELDAPAARELQEHLAVCEACRASYDALVEEEKEVRSGFEALAQPRADRAIGAQRKRIANRACVSAYPTTISLKGSRI